MNRPITTVALDVHPGDSLRTYAAIVGHFGHAVNQNIFYFFGKVLRNGVILEVLQ